MLTRLGGVRLWPASSDHVADTLKHVVQVVATRAKFAALCNWNIAVPFFLGCLAKCVLQVKIYTCSRDLCEPWFSEGM